VRYGGWFALALISLGASLAFGQGAPPADQSGPPTEQTRPLTPEEERDRQIKQFDPLAKDSTDQNSTDKAAREAQQRSAQEQKPLPGSVADSDRQKALEKAGPRVASGDETEVERATDPEYTGPAVLSRSYTVYQPLISQDVKWQETFGINTAVDTGAYGVAAANGQVSYPLLYSTQTTFSLRARHAWRKEELAVTFGATDSHYFGGGTTIPNYSGGNYNLTVNYRQILTPHLSVAIIGSGVLYSQNYALENPNGAQTDVANISIASSPNIQIFDNGSKQFTTSVNFTYQQTARLSYSGGIGYFGIERNAPGFLGTTGQQAQGDLNYRLTKKTTVGLYYSWNYYLIAHGSGTTYTNTAGLIYSYALGRSVQLRLRAGGSQVETLGLQLVPIDPTIAALLGQAAGLIDSYQKFRTTDISAQIIKDFGSRRTASISYARGISPGNGIYQASEQESIGAGFNTLLWRRYAVTLTAGHDQLKSVAQTLGTYGSKSVSFGVSRALGHGLSMNFGATARRLDITNVAFIPLHDQYRITTGISYTPGEGHLLPRI
jgi:hypothetical protein